MTAMNNGYLKECRKESDLQLLASVLHLEKTKTQMAKTLGVSRSCLYRLLEKYKNELPAAYDKFVPG